MLSGRFTDTYNLTDTNPADNNLSIIRKDYHQQRAENEGADIDFRESYRGPNEIRQSALMNSAKIHLQNLQRDIRDIKDNRFQTATLHSPNIPDRRVYDSIYQTNHPGYLASSYQYPEEKTSRMMTSFPTDFRPQSSTQVKKSNQFAPAMGKREYELYKDYANVPEKRELNLKKNNGVIERMQKIGALNSPYVDMNNLNRQGIIMKQQRISNTPGGGKNQQDEEEHLMTYGFFG